MSDPRRRLLVLGGLLALLGCQGLSPPTGTASLAGLAASEEVPALAAGATPLPNGGRPAATSTTMPDLSPRPPEGRTLLKTGGIQLGPGVGHNLWGWQGDGLGGF